MLLPEKDFIKAGSLWLGLLLLALAPAQLYAYSGVADVTLSWGVGGTAISWSSTAQNSLTVADNSTHLTTAPGSNGTIYFNPDFAAASDYGPGTGDDCLTLLSGYNTIELRKYGCRQLSSGSNLPVFQPSPTTDAGPAAAAAGTLFFTDTTLTGTLTVLSTTDEPTGGNESSIGDGASGFNLRALDTFAFGNVWFGVSTGATLTVDLTGDFSPTGWEITGGTVRLSDPAFQCQQRIGEPHPDHYDTHDRRCRRHLYEYHPGGDSVGHDAGRLHVSGPGRRGLVDRDHLGADHDFGH